MAFAEQFIYLCLRHLWVLQAASHRFLSGSDILDENQKQSVKKIIKQTARTFKEDNGNTDWTSGGAAAHAACARDFSLFTAKASVLTDICSRSAPLVNGVRA